MVKARKRAGEISQLLSHPKNQLDLETHLVSLLDYCEALFSEL